MSYYKMKYLSIDSKRNHIFITIADSSIRPLRFHKLEFDEENPIFLNKAVKLARLILNGELQPTGGCNRKDFFKMLFDAKHTIPFDPFDMDFHYHTNTNDMIVYDFIARKVSIPYCTGRAVDMEAVKQEIKDTIIPQINAIYEKAQIEAMEKGQIFIRSALSLFDKFTGFDLLWSYDNEIIVAPQKNYNNRGILDNSDGSAIFLKKDSLTPKDKWEILAYWDRQFCERQFPALVGIGQATNA